MSERCWEIGKNLVVGESSYLVSGGDEALVPCRILIVLLVVNWTIDFDCQANG